MSLLQRSPATPPGALTLALRRVQRYPRLFVYEAFCDPGELAKWWGPKGFSTPCLEFRPRVGASYRIQMQPPEGPPFCLTGDFREVEPHGRLVFTFAWEDPDPDDAETVVTLAFRDLGDVTEVALTQGLFQTEARLALHRNGWTDSFDRLERLIPA